MSRVILKSNPASSTPSDNEEKAWTEPSINFRTGMFRPVATEAENLNCRIVQGAIPSDFPEGTYFRNGPNPYFPPKDTDAYHYFDGDGMIASFSISSSTIRFSHKWVNTERLQADIMKNKSVYEFGSMATGKLLLEGTVNEKGVRMGKANTSLIFHNNKLLALEEADLPYIIHPQTLETLGSTYSFEKYVGSGADEHVFTKNIFTAHPKIDKETKELIGYGCGYDPTKAVFDYYVINQNGFITTKFPIPLRGTSYNHDFAITKNYSICFDGNLTLNWQTLFASDNNKLPEKPGEMWQFNSDKPGRIGIFPRHAKSEQEVTWFDVEPFCVSHTVNAYEEDGTIVIISNNIGYEGFEPNFPSYTPKDPLANLHEWRLNLKTKGVKERNLRGNIRSDFPCINNKYTGKKNRYLYSQLVNYEEPNHAPFLYGAYKYDLKTNTYKEQIWRGSDDIHDDDGKFYGGEGIFVPRINRQRSKARNIDDPNLEDDGYLLVLVNNVNKRRTELRMYDCKCFGERNSLKCTIESPRRLLPLGTHGIWLNKDEVEMGP